MPFVQSSKPPAPSRKADTALGGALRGADDILGDAASPQALARLNAAVADLKLAAVRPLLERSLAALKKRDMVKGGELAIKALEIDETNGHAWYLLAIAREGMSDFKSSLECYEAALKLMPKEVSVANDLGRLAARMGMHDMAERLFRVFLREDPQNSEAINNLACMVRDQQRTDEAIEILRNGIMAAPETAILWGTLASVLSERGDAADSLPFYDEAIRLDPSYAKSYYNRSTAMLALGRTDEALRDCDRALQGELVEHERVMMQLARATILLTRGELAEGWDAYEARLSPHYVDSTNFLIDRPQWRPQDDLTGKSFFLYGEQGLGDEVLFANMIPDLIEALGPEGRLQIAVQGRLVSLFARSFPQATVGVHQTATIEGHTVRAAEFLTDPAAVDLWAPMASLTRRFRRSVEDYPARPRFLTADPLRVDHWKSVLAEAPPGPKVGILWKSMKITAHRARHYAPFHDWAPVLATPGVCFVNLQYGDCEPELEAAREHLGVDIWQPPGIDLMNDLDDLAALTCAMDLIIGPANATTNIAAACGAPLWLVGTPGAWTCLGADRYPWYPQARLFVPEAFNSWETVMAQIGEALAQAF